MVQNNIQPMQLVYKPERDKDFYNVCEQIRKENKGYIKIDDIVSKAVVSPAESYYISAKQIREIIQLMRCSKCIEHLSESKQSLYKRILELYMEEKKKNPELSVTQIASLIDEYTAPRFYMSVERAKGLYYKLMNEYAVLNRSRFLDKFFRIQ